MTAYRVGDRVRITHRLGRSEEWIGLTGTISWIRSRDYFLVAMDRVPRSWPAGLNVYIRRRNLERETTEARA